MNKFEHVISLGHVCLTASELERIGLRDGSGPFDWCRTQELEQIINLIQNDFVGHLDYKYLYQDTEEKLVYSNIKYKIVFNHDFGEYEPLSSQLPNVKNKYNRRINRFYNHIKEPTLFIRDIYDVKDLKYIEENQTHINDVLKSFNETNKIIFILRNNLESKVVKLYKAETERNWRGHATFIKTNKELYNYLDKEIYYPKNKRKNNYLMYKKKTIKSIFTKTYNKLKSKYKNIFHEKYNHNYQQSYKELL